MNDKNKAKGVIRKVDELGRITLLKEDRDLLGIKPETQVEIHRRGKEIIIRKCRGMCEICEKSIEDKNIIKIEDKFICKDCMEKIGMVIKEQNINKN